MTNRYRYCRACGAPLAGAMYCGACGASLNEQLAAARPGLRVAPKRGRLELAVAGLRVALRRRRQTRLRPRR